MNSVTYKNEGMWAKIAGKGGKGGRIQPPILLNFSIHLRSQHCALSSAVGLLGHHFFALPLLFIWGQTYLESTFHPGELNAYLVFIQILYCSFSLLQIQISTKLLLCLVIASSLICLDLSCLCSGSIISPFFFPFWNMWAINMWIIWTPICLSFLSYYSRAV